jgi:hypothetical protein
MTTMATENPVLLQLICSDNVYSDEPAGRSLLDVSEGKVFPSVRLLFPYLTTCFLFACNSDCMEECFTNPSNIYMSHFQIESDKTDCDVIVCKQVEVRYVKILVKKILHIVHGVVQCMPLELLKNFAD